MLSRARRVAGVVVTAILVAVLLGVAVLFWLVRQEGWLIQTVATGSMAPTIPTGSLIVSRPVDAGEIAAGDVIVFRSPTGAVVSGGADGVFEATDAMLITHRVVAVSTENGTLSFRTRGDGNAEEDPWAVVPAMVRARYVAHVPGLGGLLGDPVVRRSSFLAVAAAAAVVAVGAARSFVREVRAERAGRAVPAVSPGSPAADDSDLDPAGRPDPADGADHSEDVELTPR